MVPAGHPTPARMRSLFSSGIYSSTLANGASKPWAQSSVARCPICLMSPSRKALSCPHHGPAENPRTHRAFQLDDNVALTHQAAVDALLLTPLRSATVLSLVLAAFSSFRLVVRRRTTSPCPSCCAQAIREP